MSKVMLIVGVVIVLIIIAFVGFRWYKHKMAAQTVAPVVSHQIASPVAMPSASASATSTTTSTGTSNQALDSDFSSIDQSLTKLNSDSQTANQDTSSQDIPAQ